MLLPKELVHVGAHTPCMRLRHTFNASFSAGRISSLRFEVEHCIVAPAVSDLRRGLERLIDPINLNPLYTQVASSELLKALKKRNHLRHVSNDQIMSQWCPMHKPACMLNLCYLYT